MPRLARLHFCPWLCTACPLIGLCISLRALCAVGDCPSLALLCPQAMASVTQVPLGAIPNYGGRTRCVRGGMAPWHPYNRASLCKQLLARNLQHMGQRRCCLPLCAAYPGIRSPLACLCACSEGTNATHHRWGIDRVPTPKEIVQHLDQYVIGQVRGAPIAFRCLVGATGTAC